MTQPTKTALVWRCWTPREYRADHPTFGPVKLVRNPEAVWIMRYRSDPATEHEHHFRDMSAKRACWLAALELDKAAGGQQ